MPRWLGLTSPAMSSTASGTTPSHRDRQIKLLYPDRPLGRLPFLAVERLSVNRIGVPVGDLARVVHQKPGLLHGVLGEPRQIGFANPSLRHGSRNLAVPADSRERIN